MHDKRVEEICLILQRRAGVQFAKSDCEMSQLRYEEARDDMREAQEKLRLARDLYEEALAAWNIDDFKDAMEKAIHAGA